jgi:hypothetical protein
MLCMILVDLRLLCVEILVEGLLESHYVIYISLER